MRKIKTIVIILAAVALSSCVSTPDYARREKLLTKAAKPVTIVSVSSDDARYCSVLMIDAKGRMFTMDSEALGSLNPGDQITKNGVIPARR